MDDMYIGLNRVRKVVDAETRLHKVMEKVTRILGIF